MICENCLNRAECTWGPLRAPYTGCVKYECYNPNSYVETPWAHAKDNKEAKAREEKCKEHERR